MFPLRNRSVALSLLLALAGAVALHSVPGDAQQPAGGSAEPAASVGSPAAADPRPSPAPLSPELAEIRRDLQRTIDASGWRGAQWGVIAVSLDRGDTIFSMNPDVPLPPASNMKLFSTAAALYYLGPDFRYSTYVLADGEVRDGVLDGDVILYGTGDPAISARMVGRSLGVLEALADSLASSGVREIAGDVVGDGSYFDDRYLGEGWSPSYRLASYSAPVGALALSDNLITIRALPGATAGAPAEIQTVPATRGLTVRNEVRTVASGRTSVRFEHDEQGIVLSGQIARGHGGVRRVLPVVDPNNFTAAAFRVVLEERGISIRGGVRTVTESNRSRVGMNGRAQDGDDSRAPRVLGVHLSPPLSELVHLTNQVSQNMYAEALLKTVGRVVMGEGSAAAGARAVQFMLECEADLGQNALRMVDGSGLSRLNAVTPRATVQLLEYMSRSEQREAFDYSLPEAAAPGSLRHSLRNRLGLTPAARNLRAKTGTINRVSSLAGYVNSASGERIAFVIFVNETPSTAIAKRIEDAVGIRLATFDRPPLPTRLAQADPAPARDTPAGPATEVAAEPRAVAPSEPAPQAPEPEVREHTIRQGETLDAISRRYGTSVRELERLNPGLNPRRLQLGQRVRIPG
jgi:serine-type D-Ala-D-Ala carboxypeptidase/endopeptidase (penicillin-binding protein 4)